MAQIATPPVQNGPFAGTSSDQNPVDRLIRRFERAKGMRARWEDLFDDCLEYGLPGADRMRAGSDGEAKTTSLYDTTAVSALADFASRIQSYVCPIGARWSTLEAGPAVPEEQRPDINRELKAIETHLFKVLENSNFDMQAAECFSHLGIGTACMAVEEGDAVNPVVFTAIPLNELVLENGGLGVYRCRTVLNRDLPFLLPDISPPQKVLDRLSRDPEGTTEVVEACVRMPVPGQEVWEHSVLFMTDRAIVDQQLYVGAGSCPYLPFFWMKAAGDTYGRGPLASVIGAVKVLNLIVELMLDHAEIQATGMWQADDDGVINPETVQLVGGAIIPRAPGSKGLEALTPGGRIEWAQWGLEQMRGEIRRALFDEPLGNMQQDARIQTAQEVVERVADLSRRVGSSFGRLQAEFVQPLIRRVLYILRRQGRIKMPTLSNRVVEIKMTSPVGRTQKTAEVVAIQRLNQVMVEMFGPGAATMFLKKAETVDALSDRLGVPINLVNSPNEVRALEQQQQQQAMMMEILKGAGMPEGGQGLL